MNNFGSALVLVWVVTLFPAVAGCGQAEEESRVEHVYDRMLEAVRSGDESALYEMSRPEFQAMFESLAVRLTDVHEWISVNESRLDRENLTSALLLDQFRFPVNGKDLFKEFVALDGLTMGPSIQAGLSVADCGIRGEQAVVTTRSGETFGFHRGEGGKWMSMLPERGYEVWPERQQFLDNLAAVEQAIETEPK